MKHIPQGLKKMVQVQSETFCNCLWGKKTHSFKSLMTYCFLVLPEMDWQKTVLQKKHWRSKHFNFSCLLYSLSPYCKYFHNLFDIRNTFFHIGLTYCFLLFWVNRTDKRQYCKKNDKIQKIWLWPPNTLIAYKIPAIYHRNWHNQS